MKFKHTIQSATINDPFIVDFSFEAPSATLYTLAFRVRVLGAKYSRLGQRLISHTHQDTDLDRGEHSRLQLAEAVYVYLWFEVLCVATYAALWVPNKDDA